MKPQGIAGSIAMILMLSACALSGQQIGTPSPGGGSTQNAPALAKASPRDAAYVFAAPSASPVQAAVTLDESSAVEALIPVAGGKLSAKGADGTTYTLEIPADALLNETTVRMTPVGSLTGLPFGSGAPLAVQLEPEGLFFNNFATLTITPTQAIPLDQQLMFTYQGSGKDVILAMPVVDSREIKIRLQHFSGYGVTKGLLADIEPVRQRIGGDAERRLQSLTAERLGAERQRQLLGSGEKTPQDLGLEDLFKQYEEQVVKPRIAAAGESCAAGRLALQSALGLERQRQLVGYNANGLDQYLPLMDTVSTVCVKEEYELCAKDHIIHRMIPVWLGMQRQYQLLGGGGDAAIQLAKDLTQKCLTFELQFESAGVFDDGGGGGYDSNVKSKVKLHVNLDEVKIRGESALINESFTFRTPGCSVTSNRGGGTFTATSLVYVTDTRTPTDAIGVVRDFKLSYFPGTTSETFSVTCPDTPTYTSKPNGLWSAIYLVLHYPAEFTSAASPEGQPPAPPAMPALPGMADGTGLGDPMNPLAAMAVPQMQAGDSMQVTGWEILGKELYAQKEWVKEDASIGLTERGTFKLYHRPGQ